MSRPPNGPAPLAAEPPKADGGPRGGATSVAGLKNQALRYLSQREHSRAELRQKLLRYLAGRRRREALRDRAAAEIAASASRGSSHRPAFQRPALVINAADDRAGTRAEARAAVHADVRAEDRAEVHPEDQAELAAATSQAEAQAIEAVLDRLSQTDLLSDERAAAALVRAKGARFGQRHLKLQLQAKGLEAELVTQALQALGGNEHERAWALWQRRFGQPPANDKERARQTRFLLARGFAGETVARVVRQALADQG